MSKYSLIADAECWEFKEKFPEEFKAYGCGPGGIGDMLVPDTMWGLSVRDACRIHDWGYRHCEEASEDDRKRHDELLRLNSIIIIETGTKYNWLKTLRLRRAKTYYGMVRKFGKSAYWSERE